MITRVVMSQPNATLVTTATAVEKLTIPKKKVFTPAPANTPATPVEVTAMRSVGAHRIQCFEPSDTGRPLRTCNKVMHAITRRHVCLIVIANQILTADAGSLASA
jgi:hypothetical protein